MFLQHTSRKKFLDIIIISILVLLAASFISYERALAQATSGDVLSRRAQLEAELSGIEKDIESQRKILAEKQREGVSLERDIAILDAEISKAKLSVKARTINIKNIEEDIGLKSNTIGNLSDKINREIASLAQLLRKADEIESSSLVEVVLSSTSISEFFADVDAFEAIKSSLSNSINAVEADKVATEREKNNLEEKKSEELSLRQVQELEKKRLEQNEIQKQQILKVTKGKEKEYQTVLKSKEKSAASIRSELFTLQGSKAIPFEKALLLANRVLAKTGVRPAFLLGIIAEESNLGQNVGTGNWKVDMKAPRDTEPFLKITAALGLDPDKMPVSKKAWYGYGGAMGPAQFIPSTWVGFQDRIASLTGHNPPNPWDPEDAFMAAGMYLSDNGASTKVAKDERYSALCYLAGCKNAQKSSYAFYGDDVMELATKYQRQIDILQGN
ncbi:MAG: lytic murein transglycosylase [bacterium]|nr:lytic murein transglycosylase [bacterium]